MSESFMVTLFVRGLAQEESVRYMLASTLEMPAMSWSEESKGEDPSTATPGHRLEEYATPGHAIRRRCRSVRRHSHTHRRPRKRPETACSARKQCATTRKAKRFERPQPRTHPAILPRPYHLRPCPPSSPQSIPRWALQRDSREGSKPPCKVSHTILRAGRMARAGWPAGGGG